MTHFNKLPQKLVGPIATSLIRAHYKRCKYQNHLLGVDYDSSHCFQDPSISRHRDKAICLSVVVVVGTKIVRSRVLGICASCKHNQLVDIGEKLVYTRFELLKKAYIIVLKIVHFLFSMPVVYRPHPLF